MSRYPHRLVVGAVLFISTFCACTESEIAMPQAVLTDTATMMDWIAEITAQGVRRPGYPADDWIEGWAADHFREFGLQNVTLDPVAVKRWEPHACSLTVTRIGGLDQELSLPCFPVPFSGHTTGLEGELALSTGSEDDDLDGKIAVAENRFLALPQTVLSAFARWVYDPLNEVPTHTQTLPFGAAFANVMGIVIERGATGFIGILRGLPWDTDRYYVPYDAEERPIPGVWLSERNGDALLAFLAQGPARARLVLERTLEPATSHNVIGTLPGASNEWIIIGSHHDGPWASAVEDASGVALVLAQARYWASVPQAERPHNLMFLLNSGHMSGGAGLIHFVTTNRDFITNDVLVEIHLEHTAREARGENGRLVPTDRPEFRWWFTSWIPALEDAVATAICTENLDRSLIMPPEGFPPGSANPPTDAAFFHPTTPIVSFLTAPMYLFDEGDTIEMIHEDSLEPLTRATIQIVNAMRGQTAASLRSQIYVPPSGRVIAPCAAIP